ALEWDRKFLILVLVLFPYLLYRFSATFRRPPAWVEWTGALLTAASALSVFLFEQVPTTGEHRSAAFLAYTFLVVVQWLFLMVVVAVRLWQGGQGQPRISRNR